MKWLVLKWWLVVVVEYATRENILPEIYILGGVFPLPYTAGGT